MKVDFAATCREERVTLAEKLRLKRAQTIFGARIALKISPQESAGLRGFDRALLERWAGPQLKELVSELDRAGRNKALSEVVISKPATDGEAAKAIGRRARVFAELVTFTLAEQRLAAEAKRGLADGEPGDGEAQS